MELERKADCSCAQPWTTDRDSLYTLTIQLITIVRTILQMNVVRGCRLLPHPVTSLVGRPILFSTVPPLSLYELERCTEPAPRPTILSLASAPALVGLELTLEGAAYAKVEVGHGGPSLVDWGLVPAISNTTSQIPFRPTELYQTACQGAVTY